MGLAGLSPSGLSSVAIRLTWLELAGLGLNELGSDEQGWIGLASFDWACLGSLSFFLGFARLT